METFYITREFANGTELNVGTALKKARAIETAQERSTEGELFRVYRTEDRRLMWIF